MIKLTKDYIKVRIVNNSTLAKLINYYQTNRGESDSGYLYDLQCSNDFKYIVDMYTVSGAVAAFNIYDRFWWGGNNFPYEDCAMCDFISNGLNAKSMGKVVFKPFVENEKIWEWILGEIEERIITYLANGVDIPIIESYFGDIIDIKRFVEDKAKRTREGKLKGAEIDGHVLNTIIPINRGKLELTFKTESGDCYLAFYDCEEDIIPYEIHKWCPFIID